MFKNNRFDVMSKTEEILKRRFTISEHFEIIEDFFKILDPCQFPSGIKGSFILIDIRIQKPCLLIDNTDYPHEYHMHTNLPKDKYPKIFLGTKDYIEARNIFYAEVKRIINED